LKVPRLRPFVFLIRILVTGGWLWTIKIQFLSHRGNCASIRETSWWTMYMEVNDVHAKYAVRAKCNIYYCYSRWYKGLIWLNWTL
jgi:hypothetical protein